MKKLLFGAFLLAGVSFGFAKEIPQAQNISTGVERSLTESKTVKTIRFDSKEAAVKFIDQICTDIYIFENAILVGSVDSNGILKIYYEYEYDIIIVEYNC